MSKESAYLELRFRSPDETTRSSTWLFVNQLGNYVHFVSHFNEKGKVWSCQNLIFEKHCHPNNCFSILFRQGYVGPSLFKRIRQKKTGHTRLRTHMYEVYERDTEMYKLSRE